VIVEALNPRAYSYVLAEDDREVLGALIVIQSAAGRTSLRSEDAICGDPYVEVLEVCARSHKNRIAVGRRIDSLWMVR